jgi:hypothetical protein
VSAILAIDPGSTYTAWVLLVGTVPVDHDKEHNEDLIARLRAGVVSDHHDPSLVVIESMSPRGMPTSAQEMETLWWAGRFAEAAHPLPVERITRDAVKYHLTGRRAKVTDTNVRAALIDRYGGIGGKDAAIGTKRAPGPLHGITADRWAALAVGVSWLDLHDGGGL